MTIEKLLQQKQELEAQIKQLERAQKAKPKFEKAMLETLDKHSDVLLCDPAAFKKSLDDFVASYAGRLELRQH